MEGVCVPRRNLVEYAVSRSSGGDGGDGDSSDNGGTKGTNRIYLPARLVYLSINYVCLSLQAQCSSSGCGSSASPLHHYLAARTACVGRRQAPHNNNNNPLSYVSVNFFSLTLCTLCVFFSLSSLFVLIHLCLQTEHEQKFPLDVGDIFFSSFFHCCCMFVLLLCFSG